MAAQGSKANSSWPGVGGLNLTSVERTELLLSELEWARCLSSVDMVRAGSMARGYALVSRVECATADEAHSAEEGEGEGARQQEAAGGGEH